MQIFIIIIVITTSIWALFDARKYKKQAKEMGRGESPSAWFLGCLLLWIVIFPYYLVRRAKYKKLKIVETGNKLAKNSTKPGAINRILTVIKFIFISILIGIILLSIIVICLNTKDSEKNNAQPPQQSPLEQAQIPIQEKQKQPEVQKPETETPTKSEQDFLSFICSKPENGHTSFYYLITDYTCPTNQSFTLPEKITDATVRLSTITGKTGWDTQSLCSTEAQIDLPPSQWQILTVGSDCGLGAAISPCDTKFISDSTGVTGIVVFPDIKGYVSGAWKYCKKGALLKVTGRIVSSRQQKTLLQQQSSPKTTQIKESWQTVKTYQGKGNQKLGLFVIPKKDYRFKMAWKNIPEFGYDEPFWGIWECEDDSTYSSCSFLIPAGALETKPIFRLALTNPYLEVKVSDDSISWAIEVQEIVY